MGQYLEWDLVGTIASVANDASPTSHPLTSGLQNIVTRNRFLGIPVSEHRAGRQALDLIQQSLVRGNVQELPLFVSVYLSLMNSHIRKEDDCLFRMVDELLPKEIQTKLVDQATEFERQVGLDRVQEAKRCFKR